MLHIKSNELNSIIVYVLLNIITSVLAAKQNKSFYQFLNSGLNDMKNNGGLKMGFKKGYK